MSRPKVRDMPRSQQQAVMSKINNPGSGSGRSHSAKPNYNIPKRSSPPKKKLKPLKSTKKKRIISLKTKADSMIKRKVWKEVWSMPSGIEPTDKLLIKGHMFIRSELGDKINKGDPKKCK